MSALVTTAFLFASALLQAEAATPAPSSTSAPAPGVSAPAAEEKKVCRKEQEIGSIMPKRICRTQAEWNAIDREMGSDAQTQLDDMRSRRPN